MPIAARRVNNWAEIDRGAPTRTVRPTRQAQAGEPGQCEDCDFCFHTLCCFVVCVNCFKRVLTATIGFISSHYADAHYVAPVADLFVVETIDGFVFPNRTRTGGGQRR